jgi:hypothetical protein
MKNMIFGLLSVATCATAADKYVLEYPGHNPGAGTISVTFAAGSAPSQGDATTMGNWSVEAFTPAAVVSASSVTLSTFLNSYATLRMIVRAPKDSAVLGANHVAIEAWEEKETARMKPGARQRGCGVDAKTGLTQRI